MGSEGSTASAVMAAAGRAGAPVDLFPTRFNDWCIHLESRSIGSTADDYARVVLALRKLHPDLWSLTVSNLEAFVTRPRTSNRRPPSKYTMKREQVVLRQFYAFCSKRYGAPNPAQDLQVVKIPQSVPRPIPPEWISRALRFERNPRWRLAILLACDAGLRRSEILSLVWEDVSFNHTKRNGWMVINGKGDRERTIPFMGRLYNALSKLDKHGSRVFSDTIGRELNGATLLQAIQRAFERVGLPGATVHRLRHSFGTSLFAHGVDARTAQVLLGHASLQTTQIYADVDDPRKMSAIFSINGTDIAS